MQPSFHEMKVRYSGADSWEEMKNLPVHRIFEEEVCHFFNQLSIAIRTDSACKAYPDLLTFGFFCRKANLERQKREYQDSCRIGRGLSFHIAPSNVPINFAYTLVAGLLAGNACVVRASTKEFEQTRILCRLIKQVIEEQALSIGKYIAIIQYEHQKEITDYFSMLSDIRVIWGGDATIEEIRKSRIPPRWIELVFSDRYSACVMYAEKILVMRNWTEIAQNFYNDTYLYDQNACSSPRLLYWIGKKEEIRQAKELFWNGVYKQVIQMYTMEPIIVVDKLTMAYRLAIEKEGVHITTENRNVIYRMEVITLESDLSKYSCPGGSYLEYSSETLSDLEQLITKKFQTLSYLGGGRKRISRLGDTERTIRSGSHCSNGKNS